MYDESNDTGTTLQDQRGQVYEWEVYQDAVDKQECENKCYFSYMDMHRMSCPLFSGLDEKKIRNAQIGIDIARGK